MKKIVFLVLSVLGFALTQAQSLNDKGLYTDSEGELFNGTITQTKSDLKSEFQVKDGMVNGEARYFYASGKLMESGTFTKGQKDQKWVRYNENGTTSAIAFYSLGKKTGTWLVFDDTGKKRFEMNYTDGEKTGIWTSWDENGAVASTKDYSKVY
jgi:antitoxin component YwqK of YwqJK toxin-antitoxin module